MDRSTERRLTAVLLAAGEARRFGSPKQLALIDGIALVRRSALAILDTGLPLMVVTGAYPDAVAAALEGLPLSLHHNPHWQQGMGSSIACAIEALVDDDAANGAMICLADQAQVGTPQLQRLLDAHARAPGGITAADHGSAIGPPCVFAHKYFSALAQLRGHEGARRLLAAHAAEVRRVAIPEAGVDIDTLDQYRALIANVQRN